MIGRAAWLQARHGAPTVGLVDMLAERFADDTAFAAPAACGAGGGHPVRRQRPRCPSGVAVPLPVVRSADAARSSRRACVGMVDALALLPSLRAAAPRGRGRRAGGALVVRSGQLREARVVAMRPPRRRTRAPRPRGRPPAGFARLALTGCVPVISELRWAAALCPTCRAGASWLIAAGPT
jgi:hypothetical protein